MTTALAVMGIVGGIVLMVVKAFAVDQSRGHFQRYIRADVEATIASLPHERQVEWAEEWRADLAEVTSMPLTAIRFAWDLRQSARELVGEPALAPTDTHGDFKRARSSATAPSRRFSFGQPHARDRRRLFVLHVAPIASPYIRWGLASLTAVMIATLLLSPRYLDYVVYVAIPVGALGLIVAGGMLVAGNPNGVRWMAWTAVGIGVLLLAQGITAGALGLTA